MKPQKEFALFNRKLLAAAAPAAIAKLNPFVLISNPMMFVVEVVSVLATLVFIKGLIYGSPELSLEGQVAGWLWFTVLSANYAEAVAEGHGKARADSLRATQLETSAKRLISEHGTEFEIARSSDLTTDDVVLVEAGEIIPADGEVIEGIASVDESAITG
jgi:potassium-transporting ATPase ATP-binding subunit